MHLFLPILMVILVELFFTTAYAQTNTPVIDKISIPKNATPVEEKALKEEKLPPKYFNIVFYKPTYVLPFYYTGSPYNSVYENNTPNNESLNHAELKFQISLKVPVWKNIFNSNSSLFLAYTQLSYWQAYNKTAFFRETDYEPEIFLANEVNWSLIKNWKLNFLNIGYTHQSNGFGDNLERSWNRIYLQAITDYNNWMFSIRPWYIIPDHTLKTYNADIANYLGYGSILLAYKFNQQSLALETYNFFESGAKRPSVNLTWSFPLTSYLYGYMEFFTGYGQSLIEYNHHTNSFGLGVALNNWI